jgi:hypothetical protein
MGYDTSAYFFLLTKTTLKLQAGNIIILQHCKVPSNTAKMVFYKDINEKGSHLTV